MKKKRILTLILAAVFVFLPSSLSRAENETKTVAMEEEYVESRAAYSAGNTMSDAANIFIGSSYHGTISETNSEDWYRFPLNSSGRVTLTAMAEIAWIYYEIYDSAGNMLWSINPSWNDTTKIISTSETIDLTEGSYYFVIKKSLDCTGNYSFQLAFASSGESFAESEDGSDNTIYTANLISLNKKYAGQLAVNDEKDFYKFTLTSSGRITFTAAAEITWIYYEIYDSAGNMLWSINPSWNDTTKIISTSETIDLTEGSYYFVIKKSLDCTGNYSFQLAFASSGESFAESEDGSDNTIYTANLISLNKKYAGQLAVNDEKDFYKFTLASSGRITLTAAAEITWINYEIYDSAGNPLWGIAPSWNDITKISNTSETIDLTEGSYYFVVKRYFDCTGNYSFTISNGSSGAGDGKGTGAGTAPMQNWKNASKYTLFVSEGMWMDKSGLTGNIVWRSSKPKVASVSSSGRVYAKKPGTTVISARVGGKVFRSTIRVNSVLSVSKKSLKISRNGGRRTVTITFRKKGSVNYRVKKSKYISCRWGRWSGNKCALIIYGQKRGKTTITITNSYNNEKKMIKVLVR